MDLGNVVLTPWHFLQGSWAENPISDTLKKFFDVPSYEKTAFNIIRASLLTGRSMVLGGRSAEGEPVPSKPWMGFQNYVRPVRVHSLSLHHGRAGLLTPCAHAQGCRNPGAWGRDNDFYQELWLQLAASGTGQFCTLSTGLRSTAAAAAVA